MPAPYRACTVWDAIGDLPDVRGRNPDVLLPYKEIRPITTLQEVLRVGGARKVRDQVSRGVKDAVMARSALGFFTSRNWRSSVRHKFELKLFETEGFDLPCTA
jgi:hypothetical protein